MQFCLNLKGGNTKEGTLVQHGLYNHRDLSYFYFMMPICGKLSRFDVDNVKNLWAFGVFFTNDSYSVPASPLGTMAAQMFTIYAVELIQFDYLLCKLGTRIFVTGQMMGGTTCFLKMLRNDFFKLRSM